MRSKTQNLIVEEISEVDQAKVTGGNGLNGLMELETLLGGGMSGGGNIFGGSGNNLLQEIILLEELSGGNNGTGGGLLSDLFGSSTPPD